MLSVINIAHRQFLESRTRKFDPKRIPDMVFYRGEYGNVNDLSGFWPTLSFTDVRAIAKIYAQDSNRSDALPRIMACKLDIKRPVVLNPDESVVTPDHVRRALGNKMSGNDFDRLLDSVFWYDPDRSQFTKDYAEPGVYIETYRLVNSPDFMPLAKKLGFDGVVFRDVFTDTHLLDVDTKKLSRISSYDAGEDSMIEVRPFSKSQIKVLKKQPMSGGPARA